MDGWLDGWMDGWMDEWMDGWIGNIFSSWTAKCNGHDIRTGIYYTRFSANIKFPIRRDIQSTGYSFYWKLRPDIRYSVRYSVSSRISGNRPNIKFSTRLFTEIRPSCYPGNPCSPRTAHKILLNAPIFLRKKMERYDGLRWPASPLVDKLNLCGQWNPNLHLNKSDPKCI